MSSLGGLADMTFSGTGRWVGPLRTVLPFRAVNRADRAGHNAELQRHHLLPRELLKYRAFASMFRAIGTGAIDFEDFRANGLLLPCRESAALAMALPLHRGPHRRYTEVVTERIGQVEASWSLAARSTPVRAREAAQMRLTVLQRALRRYLLEGRKRRPVLNRRDPARAEIDYADLDAMAELVWSSTVTPGAQPMPMRASSSSRAS